MTRSKNFLHKEPNFIVLSRFRLIVGVFLGLLYSFSFYSFLYILRETFRILSVTEKYDLWVLTDKEVNFYNLVFAFLSVIIGQSVCFVFWFDQPKKIFGIRNHRKTAIVNDQRALNWYFLSWFSKLAIVFGLLFGFTFSGGFYVFSLYPAYNYLFILIIVVLYLQTWNTISLTFKRKGQKWMLISGLIITIVAFSFSRINLVDYKTINRNFLQKNIHYNYNLELQESSSCESAFISSLTENIYIVETKTQQANDKPVIVVDNERITIERLHEKIAEWQSLRSKFDVPYMVYRLNIHGSIKMNFINQVRNELSESGISRIAYAVVPLNHEFDQRYYQDFSFPMILPKCKHEGYDPKKIYQDFGGIKNIIEAKRSESDYLINSSLVKTNQIKDTLKFLIQQNSDYIIKFFVNDNDNFTDYFKVLSSAKEALDELRNEYAQEKYSKQYNLLDYEEENDVRQKFPFHIFEITPELNKRIENE